MCLLIVLLRGFILVGMSVDDDGYVECDVGWLVWGEGGGVKESGIGLIWVGERQCLCCCLIVGIICW